MQIGSNNIIYIVIKMYTLCCPVKTVHNNLKKRTGNVKFHKGTVSKTSSNHMQVDMISVYLIQVCEQCLNITDGFTGQIQLRINSV